MSGHSKWAGIKHKKGLLDAKRGAKFTKLIRELTVAAKNGGGNPENNARLRKAIEIAREQNMPQDNIKKAVQRGTGELPGVVYEETTYEGYGPNGVAVYIEATTDNKNRTTSEIRRLFSQNGGNLGETGCVNWMFSKKGLITINKSKYNEDELMTMALDLGADDFLSDDKEVYEIITAPEKLENIKQELTNKKIETIMAEVDMIPKNYIKLEGKDAEQMLRLMSALEENEDVNHSYANFDISQETMERVSAETA